MLPVSGGCKHIVNTGVHGVIVVRIYVVRHGVLPQHQRQVLVVDDVLQLGHHDPPGLLEYLLIVPAWFKGVDLAGNSVVLPKKKGVETGQPGVLDSSSVSCHKLFSISLVGASIT